MPFAQEEILSVIFIILYIVAVMGAEQIFHALRRHIALHKERILHLAFLYKSFEDRYIELILYVCVGNAHRKHSPQRIVVGCHIFILHTVDKLIAKVFCDVQTAACDIVVVSALSAVGFKNLDLPVTAVYFMSN